MCFSKTRGRAVFEEFFRRVYFDLLNYANRLLEGRLSRLIEGSDLVSEAYIKARKKFDEFGGTTREDLLRWMKRFVFRTFQNHRREIARKGHLPRLHLVNPARLDLIASRVEGFEKRREITDTCKALESALERLPRRERQAVEMVYFAGKRVCDLGPLLGVRNAPHSYKSRGVMRLRDLLRKEDLELD